MISFLANLSAATTNSNTAAGPNRRGFFRRAAAAAVLTLTAFGTTAPAVAQGAYTAPWQRACVVFIADLDSPSQTQVQRNFYNLVEFGAEAAALTTLAGKYASITVVKGGNATRARLPSTLLTVASNPTINTIDLLFVTHGLSNRVYFSNTDVTIGTVANDIRNAVPWTLRRKFRMVFSTACYGESHRSGWMSAGFEVVSGASRIYADAALSYPAFLIAWANNMTFGESVAMSNLVDPTRTQDQIAKMLLNSWGYPQWWDVNSLRQTSGRTWLRIWQRPY
ncbi:MAG: hypothetical protein KDC98_03770 [Planctomycetes bacterium]|nr:hypothetical protein [Planctomycetota bacterium]